MCLCVIKSETKCARALPGCCGLGCTLIVSHLDNMRGLGFLCKVRRSDKALDRERAGTLRHATLSVGRLSACVWLTHHLRQSGVSKRNRVFFDYTNFFVRSLCVCACMKCVWVSGQCELSSGEDVRLGSIQSVWVSAGSFVTFPSGSLKIFPLVF